VFHFSLAITLNSSLCVDQPSSVFGEHLRDQVEERLKFYETGDVPQKNVDVMKSAIEQVE
jgi:hypothetical protein